uniref:Uncharacterized protein n=1 Tax=Siphoviridae sp. ctkzC12 TaxID=2826446 RepID=A0A8S5LVF9_9CAUD|nr:MAG TPA: hypothetical protein [Siphoviridae sp. ctkzC12]
MSSATFKNNKPDSESYLIFKVGRPMFSSVGVSKVSKPYVFLILV